MKTIWKHMFTVMDGPQEVAMPAGARLVSIQGQHEQPCAWFEVDTMNAIEVALFEIHGTGHPINGGEYRGTAVCGRLVWHVYEHEVKP